MKRVDRRALLSRVALAVLGACFVLSAACAERRDDAREELGDAAKAVAREKTQERGAAPETGPSTSGATAATGSADHPNPPQAEGMDESRSETSPAVPASDGSPRPSVEPRRAGGVNLPPESRRRAAPAFSLPDLDGKRVRLADLEGKVVLVNFWATWCPPCRMEIPDFIELQREFGPKGLQIVGISLDKQGARRVKPFAAQSGINYTMLVEGDAAARDYGGVSSIPTTFLLDRQGRIVHSQVGLAPKQVWKDLIEAIIQES